ncbi:MAG: metallophosphoesterase family protein [Thermomicrobiales bacterium]
MKIGLIADIHGNSFALRQVLDELADHECELIACLGDIAVLGPDPEGATRLVRECADFVVLGNVDRWLVNRLDDSELRESETPELRELAAWSLDQLTAGDLAWFDAMPMTQMFAVSNDRHLLVFHGSPASNDHVISAATPESVLIELLPIPGPAIACGGHTHVQLERVAGFTTFVNPGSVGLPGIGPGTHDLVVNANVNWAEYAVLSVVETGETDVDFRRTRLDVESMIEWSRRFGMPAQAWWESKWVRD